MGYMADFRTGIGNKTKWAYSICSARKEGSILKTGGEMSSLHNGQHYDPWERK